MDDNQKMLQELNDTISNINCGNYQVLDQVVDELLENNRDELIDKLLHGCYIDRHGRLHVSKPLVVSNGIQHKVDYAIWRLILGRNQQQSIHENLKVENLRRICFRFHMETQWDPTVIKGRRIFKMPPEITRLKHLKYLKLAGLRLEEIPDEVASITSLRVLDVSDNPLISHPTSRLRLDQLMVLRLANCGLTDIPIEATSILGLKVLDLKGNDFEKIPKTLWALESLKWFNVSGNPLNVLDIPQDIWPNIYCMIAGSYDGYAMYEIWSLPRSLRKLVLRGSWSAVLPKSIRSMEKLRHFEFTDGSVNEIPEWISELKDLRYLNISKNNSLMHIHSSIAQLPMLKKVVYNGLIQLTPQWEPEIHGEGIEGFRNLLQDHCYVHENNEDVKDVSAAQYGWIKLWKARLYRPNQRDDCYKRWVNNFSVETKMLNKLLHDRSTKEDLMQAVELMLKKEQFHLIRTLFSTLRVRDGLLYAMTGKINPYSVPEKIISETALMVLAKVPADYLYKWLGRDRITETTLDIPDNIVLPDIFDLNESGIHLSWRKKGILPFRMDNGHYSISISESMHWSTLDAMLKNSVGSLSINKAKSEEKNIVIDGWNNLRTITIFEAYCDQIMITNCPELTFVKIETGPNTLRVHIADCPNLDTLDVNGDCQSSISMENIPSIRNLKLEGIENFEIAEIITKCPNVSTLELKDCEVTILPKELSKLTKLESLLIFDRKMKIFPEHLCNLRKLRKLTIHMRDRKEYTLVVAPFTKGGYYDIPNDLYTLKYLRSCDIDAQNRYIRRALAMPGYGQGI